MRETNKYVRCILIDFSFNSVEYAIIIKMLVDLGLDQHVTDWVFSFLSGRQHHTKVEHKTSGTRIMNRSIVHDSGVGPSLFITLFIYFKKCGFPTIDFIIFCQMSTVVYMV